MLAHTRHASLALHFLLPVALFAGCVVTTADDTDTDVGQAGGSGPASSSTTTTTSASSGGGEGGGGGGGEGGGGGCVDAIGTGQTVAACDELNIAPAQGASQQCGDGRDELPIGYRLCKGGFSIFAAGHAEDLVACLAAIGVQDACDAAPAQSCFDEMFNDACTRANIAEACNVIATSCAANDTFDAGQCALDLNPFSADGLAQLQTCFNGQPDTVSCQTAYDDCYGQIVSF
jgi:hypothetical protein